MLSYHRAIIQLLKIILLLLSVFAVSRGVFLALNYDYFSPVEFNQIVWSFIGGLRFDIAIIIIFNSLIIIMLSLPGRFKGNRIYQSIVKILFVLINSVLLLADLADAKYFEFTKSRSSGDIFNFLSLGGGDDFLSMLPKYFYDFWYIAVIWIALTMFLLWQFPRLSKKTHSEKLKIRHFLYQSGFFIAILGLSFLLMRGTGLRPIYIHRAAEYVDVKYIPLALNTPFTVITTMGKSNVEPVQYFDDEKTAYRYFSPVKHYEKPDSFRAENVVIIIMESFSKEYIGALNRVQTQSGDDTNGISAVYSYTPFLDSLAEKSLVFQYAFANGIKSVDAIPSVLSAIPLLMHNSYLTSKYTTNRINSLASLLKAEKYHTSFFHGGANGTMNFDSYCDLGGFDYYFGKNEYDNKADFDGHWGIYDEPFFQYFAQKLTTFPQPFFSCIFSLSSHHPFSVPDKYTGTFPKGELKIHESIGYADYSLAQFFKTASKMAWFDNTLFVICADHTSDSMLDGSKYVKKTKTSPDDTLFTTDLQKKLMHIKMFNQSALGNYAILMYYFHPANDTLVGMSKTVTQQSDIMPSVLDYLNYKNPFIAYGESVFDSHAPHFAVTYKNGIYQYVEENYLLYFDGEKSIALYDYEANPMLTNNLADSVPERTRQMENRLKAIIQSYNRRLSQNEMFFKNF